MRLLRVPFVILLLSCLVPRSGSAQVVVNEIMYAPLSPEPEWIELYNTSTLTVDVTGWTIQDAGSAKGTLPAMMIPPKGYLVVTKDTTKLRSIRLVGARLVRVLLPSLNNSGDIVALRDSAGQMVDSLRYGASWGGTGGVSLERRHPDSPSVDPMSWGSSTSPTRATPGALNSLSPAALDLRLQLDSFDPTSGEVTATARNAGTLPTAASEAVLYVDADADGAGSAGEALARQTLPPLAPGDSIFISLAWTRTLTDNGESALLEAIMVGDERPENNLVVLLMRRPPLDSGVVINEVMYDPLTIEETVGAEYVEVYNPGSRSVAITGWQLYDGTGRAQAMIPESAPLVAANGYLVIATDSTLFRRFPALRDSENVVLVGTASFSLNVDGDDVVLRNASGRTIDSVRYSSRWHRSDLDDTKGIALERISASASSGDPRNWSSCVAHLGGTPGAINVVALPAASGSATLSAEPRIISPDGDGVEDFTRISFRLPTATSRIIATVYDRQGRSVRRIANNELTESIGELIFDGRDDDARTLAPGIYIIRLESYDEGGTGLTTAQATIIVARRL